MSIKPKIPNVVTIGGGTGSFVVLSGLKKYPINLISLVTMMDSGGSTGRLRDQLGVLPPGDLRQALVALSSSPQIWRDLFVYRFGGGDLNGHNFGNIFISALEKITGSIDDAVNFAASLLQVKGSVIPVTQSSTQLCVKLLDGSIIEGEAFIDMEETDRKPITNVFLNPNVHISEDALAAIKQADYIVLGPGDIYTSIIPNLIVNGMSDALKKSKATFLYVSNLMTKVGQTDNYKVSDHINEIEKYAKRKMDWVIVNKALPKGAALEWYERYAVSLVEDDLPKKPHHIRIKRGDFISDISYQKSASDSLKRSFIRHDSEKLAKALFSIIKGKN